MWGILGVAMIHIGFNKSVSGQTRMNILKMGNTSWWIKLMHPQMWSKDIMESFIKWVAAFIILDKMLVDIRDVWEELFMEDETPESHNTITDGNTQNTIQILSRDSQGTVDEAKKQIKLGLLGSSKGRIQLVVLMNLHLKFRNKERTKEIQDLRGNPLDNEEERSDEVGAKDQRKISV
ncbi:hypothetical protein PPACK8108_LOCUS17458 [Phakopsora pachyrhizi]|uniref:Uncharacterized protein n=1 Tax=Phakopsora pachyrhizi TaxID=170000 RepID=A0AAV0BCI4_PHAPC|nr:hypothetical protein PPACK8108_LOCUS17458 [Phakopsora pachyrhizi]